MRILGYRADELRVYWELSAHPSSVGRQDDNPGPEGQEREQYCPCSILRTS